MNQLYDIAYNIFTETIADTLFYAGLIITITFWIVGFYLKMGREKEEGE